MFITIDLNQREMVRAIMDQGSDEDVLETILAIDLTIGDCDFTQRLIDRLQESLNAEEG